MRRCRRDTQNALTITHATQWNSSSRIRPPWGSSGRRFKSCQPDAGQRHFPISQIGFSEGLTHTFDPNEIRGGAGICLLDGFRRSHRPRGSRSITGPNSTASAALMRDHSMLASDCAVITRPQRGCVGMATYSRVMDHDWMRERLKDFDKTAYQFIDNEKDYGWDADSDNLWHQLWRAEPTIRKIFGALDATLADDFDLNASAGVAMARNLAHRALGILDDRDEWAVRLQPEAPSLPADQFHPWVWDAAQTFWKSKHYRAAVDAAATAINAHTQTKVGRRDISDNDLMNQAFTERPKAGQVYLRLPGDATNDQTLRSRNNALRPFAESCFAGIRNPATHEHGDDWSQQKALEYLAALSILARWIDECDVLHGT